MPDDYFRRVQSETLTRFWVNNPTDDEMAKAMAAGAINVTTNPSYCSKLLKGEPDYIRDVIDSVIPKIEDDDIAADLVCQKCAARIMKKFLPIYEKSGGTNGYVTIQDDPRRDDDPDMIVDAALRHAKLGKNYMAKIPVIEAGIKSMGRLIEKDIPICATEVFSISQAVHICELYQRVAKKCDNHPPFYVTHITGIFDQYLESIVKYHGIDIAPKVLSHAGCAVARKEYRILKERGYKAIMLGGGARGTQHFTEMVGGDVHITINWNTAHELIEADGAVVSRMDVETPREIIDELSAKLIDFRRAFNDNGLSVKEFRNFGPVQLFRSMFLEGYYHLLSEIARRRGLYAMRGEGR